MPLKLLVLKLPTVASLSTGLTYGALTGVMLLPTLSGNLPPAAIARPADASADIQVVRARTVAVPAQVASLDPTAAEPRTAIPGSKVDEVAPPRADLPEVGLQPPEETPVITDADEIKEARAAKRKARQPRPEKVPAKDAEPHPEHEAEGDDHRAAPSADDNKKAVAPVEAKDKQPPDKKSGDAIPVDAVADGKDPPAPIAWSDAEIAEGLKSCLRLLGPIVVEIEPNPAVRAGECGTPAPILLKSIGTTPKIVLQPPAEINCPMAATLDAWTKSTLQPAAREILGSEVTRIVGSSGYSCRNRYGLANERLSEHALANAIDIAGFALADGRVIKVAAAWGTTERDRIAEARAAKEAKAAAEKAAADDKEGKSDKRSATKDGSKKSSDIPVIKSDRVTTKASLKADDSKSGSRRKGKDKDDVSEKDAETIAASDDTPTPEGRFLRRLHVGACNTFGTVLGPESNEAHRDHFHFDLKARKRRAVCQ